MSGTVEEVLLQNEDLLFSAAGVRCVIGKVRSALFDRCKVQQLQPEKMLAMCHSGADAHPHYRCSQLCFLQPARERESQSSPERGCVRRTSEVDFKV